jgi:hypothetical protein
VLKRSVIRSHVANNGGGHRENNAVGTKSGLRENVVDQESMNATIAILKWMDEDERETQQEPQQWRRRRLP